MEMNTHLPSSGDVLIWTDSLKGQSKYGGLIRFVTMSEYTHCGIAVWRDGELYVAEANVPKVRMVKLEPDDTIFFIETHIDLDEKGWEFFNKTKGLNYSYMDAVRSVLGITLKDDDRWQCAEYVTEFLKLYGIKLKDSYTPSKMVTALMHKLYNPLHKLYKCDDDND